MTFYTLFLFVCATYGITFGLKDSKIFARPRNYLAERYMFFLELFQCPYCVGFHAGWLAFLLVVPSPDSYLTWTSLFVAHAFAGAFVAGFLEAVLLRLERAPVESDPVKPTSENL